MLLEHFSDAFLCTVKCSVEIAPKISSQKPWAELPWKIATDDGDHVIGFLVIFLSLVLEMVVKKYICSDAVIISLFSRPDSWLAALRVSCGPENSNLWMTDAFVVE